MSVSRAFFAFIGVAAASVLFVLLGAHAAGADPVSDEQQFVAKINGLRASKGLSQLVVDANLTGIARAWSQSMASAGDISHNPNLKDQVTSNWSRLGENVGVGGNVPGLFDAFVASPHHYANLVDPLWTHVGVGVVMSGTTMYTSHEFMALQGGRSSGVVTRAPPPGPATTAPPLRPPATTAVATTAPPVTVPAPPPAPPIVRVDPKQERFVLEQLTVYDPGG